MSLAFSQVLHAELVKGRIQTISKQAGTVQIVVKDKNVVIRTDKNTKFDGFTGLKELSPPDLIEVEREPGQAATRIKKIVFALPPGVEIDIQQLLKIMTSKQPYHLSTPGRLNFSAPRISQALNRPIPRMITFSACCRRIKMH